MSALFGYKEYCWTLSRIAKDYLITHPDLNDLDRNFYECVAMLEYFDPQKQLVTTEEVKNARKEIRDRVKRKQNE